MFGNCIEQEVSKPGEQDAAGKSDGAGEAAATESKEAVPST